MNELVSIIMPSYNTSKFIDASIKCVINQTYSNWELIIVDDCSTDDTDALVARYCDSRIRYYKNNKKCGAAYSRNKALREANGKWIAFLDSDDLWSSEKLERQINFMKKNDYHFSFTRYWEVDESGNCSGAYITGPTKVSKWLMYTFNYLGCLTVMYDREFIGLIQIKNLEKRNDYAMWLKVVKKCPAYLLDETLASYRIRTSGSIMSRDKGVLHRLKYNYIMWKEGENCNFLRAGLLTMVNLLFGTMKRIFCKKRVKA